MHVCFIWGKALSENSEIENSYHHPSFVFYETRVQTNSSTFPRTTGLKETSLCGYSGFFFFNVQLANIQSITSFRCSVFNGALVVCNTQRLTLQHGFPWCPSQVPGPHPLFTSRCLPPHQMKLPLPFLLKLASTKCAVGRDNFFLSNRNPIYQLGD